MAAMADQRAVAADIAKRLNLTTTMLYAYVNGDGSPKAAGQAVLDGRTLAGLRLPYRPEVIAPTSSLCPVH